MIDIYSLEYGEIAEKGSKKRSQIVKYTLNAKEIPGIIERNGKDSGAFI